MVINKSANKFFFIPGYAKSGTTNIYHQLAQHQSLFNLHQKKETGLLRMRISREEYINSFQTQDGEKIYIDASPNYVEHWSHFSKNMDNSFSKDEVHLLFCLRSPFERAYSHYLHLVSKGFWKFAFSDVNLNDMSTLSYFLPNYLETVKSAVKQFGAEHVHGMSIDSGFLSLPKNLLAFLGTPEGWNLSGASQRFSYGYLPKVFFNANEIIAVACEGKTYELPPRCLLISNGEYSELIPNYPECFGNKLLENSKRWSECLCVGRFPETKDIIFRNYYEACDVMGIEYRMSNEKTVIEARPTPPLPRRILECLVCVDSINENRQSFDFGGAHEATLFNVASKIDELYLKIRDADQLNDKIRVELTLSVLVSYLEYAIKTFGPLPEYVKEYVVQSIVLSKANEARIFLQKHSEITQSVNFSSIMGKIDYFQDQISLENYMFFKGLN